MQQELETGKTHAGLQVYHLMTDTANLYTVLYIHCGHLYVQQQLLLDTTVSFRLTHKCSLTETLGRRGTGGNHLTHEIFEYGTVFAFSDQMSYTTLFAVQSAWLQRVAACAHNRFCVSENVWMSLCVCVCVCARVCLCECVCVCVTCWTVVLFLMVICALVTPVHFFFSL